MRPIKKINSSNYEINTVQDLLGSVVDDLSKVKIIDGNFLTSVSLTAGVANPVSHGLQRPVTFWIVARQNTNATVWEDTSLTTSSLLYLRCSASCVVNLWLG